MGDLNANILPGAVIEPMSPTDNCGNFMKKLTSKLRSLHTMDQANTFDIGISKNVQITKDLTLKYDLSSTTTAKLRKGNY